MDESAGYRSGCQRPALHQDSKQVRADESDMVQAVSQKLSHVLTPASRYWQHLSRVFQGKDMRMDTCEVSNTIPDTAHKPWNTCAILGRLKGAIFFLPNSKVFTMENF